MAVVGTSLTAASSWPGLLDARLDACLGIPVAVQVIAEPGATSAWGLAQRDRIVAARPDLVLVEFAINDADVGIGMPLRESRATHEALIRSIRSGRADTVIVLVTTNPARGPMASRRPALPAYYALYRDLAQRLDLGLADLTSRWQAHPDLAAALPDGLHPTDVAAAETVVPALAQVIAATLGIDAC